MELSGYADKIPKGIVLTGGGALLQNITQLYAFHFKNSPVRIGKPSKQFFNDNLDKNLNEPIYSTVTGLLLFGIEDEIRKGKEEELKKEQAQKIEKTKQKEKPNKTNPFNFLRGRLSDIFNEEDAEI
jgi:cell division protein FtsA